MGVIRWCAFALAGLLAAAACQEAVEPGPTPIATLSEEQLSSAFQSVCRGEGVAEAGEMGSLRPPRLAAVVATPAEARNEQTYVLFEWRSRTIEQTQIVVCLDETADKLGQCQYLGGGFLTIVPTKYTVDAEVRAAKTGEVLADTTIEGPVPLPCPDAIQRDDPPELSRRPILELRHWLDPFVNPRFIAGEQLGPPDATPLASPAAEPSGDGTRVVLETTAGRIVIELLTRSAPVAAQNFINLASEGFYDGLIFDRVRQGLLIEGGDPAASGTEPIWYTIRSDPGPFDYGRGMVITADAKVSTQWTGEHGSRFAILLAEADSVASGRTIFGRVVEGMDVADAIGAGTSSGPPEHRASDPVKITAVTIESGPAAARWDQLATWLAELGLEVDPNELPIVADPNGDARDRSGEPVDISPNLDIRRTYVGWISLPSSVTEAGGLFDCARENVLCDEQQGDVTEHPVVLAALQTHQDIASALGHSGQISISFDREGHDNSPADPPLLGADLSVTADLMQRDVFAIEWDGSDWQLADNVGRMVFEGPSVLFAIPLAMDERPGYRVETSEQEPPDDPAGARFDGPPTDAFMEIDASLLPADT